MNRELSLRVLAQVMGWDDDRASDEYAWLKFMGGIKYDSYRDFQAGMRFTESLATWLQQFPSDEREVAYAFVRTRLVFVGVSETQHLVEQFYPRVVHERIVRTVAARHSLPDYEAIASPDYRLEMDHLRRKTLFLGLSDGARIDVLRHSNVGRLNNEQIVPTAQLDPEKWLGLLEDLQKGLKDDDAKFEAVYLIDDFTATGTSFLRPGRKDEPWKGKLKKFSDSIGPVRDRLFSEDLTLCIHHYIASFDATKKIVASIDASSSFFEKMGWGVPQLSFGTVLPEALPLSSAGGDAAFIAMTDAYYDPTIETEHTRVGGVDRINLGYGGCALPVILEHNTPNNSVALLWAETDGDDGAHAMRPLFRRRQRHVGAR
ncbi:hypothetical protein BH11ACT4_BH11ACT4_08100 [soil metagenome]